MLAAALFALSLSLCAPAVVAAAQDAPADAPAESAHVRSLREAALEVRDLLGAGERARAVELLAEVARGLAATDEPGTEAESEALLALDDLCEELQAPEPQLAIRRREVALQAELQPGEHLELQRARWNLAATSYALGDVEQALALFERVCAAYETLLDEDDLELQRARGVLGTILCTTRQFERARAVQEEVVAAFERLLPEGEPDLVQARLLLAKTLLRQGAPAPALPLCEGAAAAYERLYEPDHPRRIDALRSLGEARYGCGDFAGARRVQRLVLAACERTLPAGHYDVLDARISLSASLLGLGRTADAMALMEGVVAEQRRQLPPDHPELLSSLSNLAVIRQQSGDLQGALALFQSAASRRGPVTPEEQPYHLTSQANLANLMAELGDLDGALALQELVVAANERTLPAGHPERLRTLSNLASTKRELGDAEGALELQEQVLAECEEWLPEDHPELVRTRANMANTLLDLGRPERARELQEEVLAALGRQLPEDHPRLLLARANAAHTLRNLGDLEGACAAEREVLATCEETFPPDHPMVLQMRGHIARTLLELDDVEGALAQRAALGAGLLARLEGALGASPREARAVAGSERSRVDCLLHLDALAGDDAAAAELVETRRHVGTAVLPGLRDAALAPLRDRLAGLQARLNDLVLGGPAAGGTRAEWKAAIERVSLERDAAQRELRSRAAGGFVGRVTPAAVAAALPDGGLAVGYLRYERWSRDPETKRLLPAVDSLLAVAVAADGAVRRVELGPTARMEERVNAWRAAIGKPVARGVAPAEVEAEERALGRALRRALLDPVLAAAGGRAEGAALHLCPDGLLHLVPFDALPLEREGARLGDRLRVRTEVSFARLLAGGEAERGGGLLLLGDVDFDRALDGAPLEGAPAERVAPLDPDERAAAFGDWPRLFGTRGEVNAIGALYEERFDAEPKLLTRAAATKAALYDGVAGQRFVHVATHGWFAPESVLSTADAPSAQPAGFGARLERAVKGLAPMTLCGLCLAGANRGRDAVGRVPGLITAEELAGYDLSACELAVLSACETNVGIHRAGQGILSLQTALHAAGARTAITSLWKVDDDLTQELMQELYTNLWERGMPKADALWAAKARLREQDFPVSAWAGWILTGDPR